MTDRPHLSMRAIILRSPWGSLVQLVKLICDIEFCGLFGFCIWGEGNTHDDDTRRRSRNRTGARTCHLRCENLIPPYIHSRSVTMADAGPVPDANLIDMAVSTPGKDASDPDKTTARKGLFQSTPKAPDKTENVSTPSTGKKRNTLTYLRRTAFFLSAVCALHGVSPRYRWLCVLPRWQINVNVNVERLFRQTSSRRNSKHDRSFRIGHWYAGPGSLGGAALGVHRCEDAVATSRRHPDRQKHPRTAQVVGQDDAR